MSQVRTEDAQNSGGQHGLTYRPLDPKITEKGEATRRRYSSKGSSKIPFGNIRQLLESSSGAQKYESNNSGKIPRCRNLQKPEKCREAVKCKK